MRPVHRFRDLTRETEAPFGQLTVYRTVPLRDAGVVYGLGSTLFVRDRVPGPDGAYAERRYHASVLDRVRRRYAGRTVTVREVHDAARLGLLDVNLEATGLLASYAIRDVLVILVAMGLAYVDISCAEPTFTLRAMREDSRV